MNIGDRIKLLRNELGITQKEFGERIGISANYVSELEYGKTKPSFLVLLAIEYRYGVSMDWLETGKGSGAIKEEGKYTQEEKEIIAALREHKELKKFVQLIIKRYKNPEAVVKKLNDLLKIL